MPVQIENFYHTFPRDLVEIALSDGSRFPMCRRTSGVFFDCFFNVRYPRAHASTISTRSRTVHKLFATPAAIAGVHRIARTLRERPNELSLSRAADVSLISAQADLMPAAAGHHHWVVFAQEGMALSAPPPTVEKLIKPASI